MGKASRLRRQQQEKERQQRRGAANSGAPGTGAPGAAFGFGPGAGAPGAPTDRDQAANVSTGAFIGAGVFAAAAVATFVLWPKHRPAERSVALVPAPGGAVVYGTF